MADTTDEIPTFTVIRKEKKVKITNTSGVTEDYVIREMLDTPRGEFLNKMNARYKPGPDGKDRLVDAKGMEADLLVRCLFKSGSDTPVTPQEVGQWPASTVSGLSDLCMAINGFGPKGEDEAKKS